MIQLWICDVWKAGRCTSLDQKRQERGKCYNRWTIHGWSICIPLLIKASQRAHLIGLFRGTISISSQMTVPNRTFRLLQPITKIYLFTIELKMWDDFRCFRSKMCFRTFSTVTKQPILSIPIRLIPSDSTQFHLTPHINPTPFLKKVNFEMYNADRKTTTCI